MKCETRSGRYRCKHNAGHDGDCEADDTPFSPRLGPFMDRDRAEAYLRGRLDGGVGGELDEVGKALDVRRERYEPDAKYRERLWSARR